MDINSQCFAQVGRVGQNHLSRGTDGNKYVQTKIIQYIYIYRERERERERVMVSV